VVWRVDANTTASDRLATLTIAARIFTLTQQRLRLPVANDVNKDGQADLVFQHDVVGDPDLDAKVGVWFMEREVRLGGGRFGPDGEPDLDWKLENLADFDGDGYPDLLFCHERDGRMEFWHMRRDFEENVKPIAPAITDLTWQLAGTSDFDGDHTPDLLFQNEVTGEMMVSFVTSVAGDFTVRENRFLTPQAVDPRWKIRGTGDLDGDGYPDIVWQDTTAGGVAVWFMQRLADGTITSRDTRWTSQPIVGDPEWKIAAVVDLDNDHRADIVWQHQAGGWVAVWFMWENVVLDTRFLTPNRVTDTGWKIVGPK
jgi:hypothetical protein